jgi:hypothetical protein
MTLRNIPVDPQRLSALFCTSLPEARADINTGEVRMDQATGQPLYLVGVLVKVVGERRAYVLDVQVPVGLGNANSGSGGAGRRGSSLVGTMAGC